MAKPQTPQGFGLAGTAHMRWGEYKPRPVTIVRQLGKPRLGTDYCSCCSKAHNGDSVRLGSEGQPHFVLLCIDCARRIGEAAK